jgi:hypothetical protein
MGLFTSNKTTAAPAKQNVPLKDLLASKHDELAVRADSHESYAADLLTKAQQANVTAATAREHAEAVAQAHAILDRAGVTV